MIIEHLPRLEPVARTPYTIWRVVPGQRHNSRTGSPELRVKWIPPRVEYCFRAGKLIPGPRPLPADADQVVPCCSGPQAGRTGAEPHVPS
jgi:hypothetical protein